MPGLKPKCGVYALINVKEKGAYVGSSKDVAARGHYHVLQLRRGSHFNVNLQRAWDSCGEDSFRLVMLIECDPADLPDWEQITLDLYRSLLGTEKVYNIAPKAYSWEGMKHGQEARDKVSRAMQGNQRTKGKVYGEETRARVSAARKGKSTSPETRDKISAALKGRKSVLSEEARRKIGSPFRGKKLSPEHRAKISQAKKGASAREGSK